MATDWSAVRAQFPALERWTYLNTATYGQLPVRAVEAVRAHLAHRDETACSDFLAWFDDADRFRELIARLIRCAPDDIAFITTASHGLAIVMNGIEWRAGDRVIALEGEFPNNLYAPAARTDGVEFCATTWDRFYDEVERGARLVLMSSVNYMTGFRPPLAAVSKFLRDRGVLFYVDGTQSVGALRFDCAEIQPDFLAVDAYKWLLGPNGAGFLYVRPDVRHDVQPTVIGWRSDRRWRSVTALHHGAPEFVDATERYEGGMLNFPSLYAMAASIEMMLEIGPECIEHRVLQLAGAARRMLESAGGSVLHSDTAILAAKFDGIDAPALAKRMREQRILVSARHGNLRVSVHFYNNEQDIAILADELGRGDGLPRGKNA
jgi:selenocysteine lyase/cysteine desulfurase